MAITEEQVYAVADSIVAMGNKPTVAAVRAHLGTGSFSTIIPFLRKWAEAQEPASHAVKFYLSNLVLGYGRFAVITTANRLDNSRDIIAEAYVFGLDQEGIFKGKWIHHHYRDGDENVIDINLDYMLQEAMNNARGIINECRNEMYLEKKDNDYLKGIVDFQECSNQILVTLKNRGYKEDLEHLAQDTHSLKLKEEIDVISSFKISISTYERGRPVR